MTSRQPIRIILTLVVILSLTCLLARCTCGGLTESQIACAKSATSSKACKSCCLAAEAAGWMYSSNSCTCIKE